MLLTSAHLEHYDVVQSQLAQAWRPFEPHLLAPAAHERRDTQPELAFGTCKCSPVNWRTIPVWSKTVSNDCFRSSIYMSCEFDLLEQTN